MLFAPPFIPLDKTKEFFMIIKVYVDILFIINFIIDYTLLLTTSFFIKKKPRVLSLILGSVLGACFAVFVFFVSVNTYFLVFLTLLTSVLMLAICYGVKSFACLFKATSVFYLVSVCFAGGCFSAMSLANKYGNLNFLVNSGVFYADIDAYTLLVIFVGFILIIHFCVGFIKKQKVKSQFLYSVTIEKNGKSVTDTAFFDTGNFVRDELSQKSVVIAEWQTVSRLFEKKPLSECIASSPLEFTYIPCRILGGKTGVFAFSPDKIYVNGIDFTSSVLVGISEKLLDSDEVFRIILPNDLNF